MSNNNRNNNTSAHTATNNALQADLAADKERIKQSNLQSERDVASNLFADTPNHLPKTSSSKGKTKSRNSRSHLSHAHAPSRQNIVNNFDGTNHVPAPAAPAVTPEVTDQNDQQQNDQMPDKEIVNSAMDVDPPSDNNENSDQQSITIEKPLDYVALVALDNITGSKPSKLITIKEALAKYNVKYNINLDITHLQKHAKVTFNDKDSYDKFLKMEIILQLKDENSDDIKNVTLNISLLKPDKQIAYITYKSQDALTYFETNWRYHIGKDTVRVLPLSLNQDARTLHKQFPFKLSGLAYNTSGYNLEPFVSGADNWKNLKKSYTDAAKSKGANKPARPSRSIQQKRLDRNTQHSEEMDEEFQTGGYHEEKSLAQSSLASSPDQAKKRVKSANDSDQEAELIQDTHDLRQSDTQIQTLLTQQNEMKSSFQSISSTMTKIHTLNKNKFIGLIDAIKDHNINIYGLSETNCSEQQAKIWQHQLALRKKNVQKMSTKMSRNCLCASKIVMKMVGIRSYFDYSQLGGKGQGVGIIIDAKYDIFVHKAVGHKGRIIYLDLYFSDKRKLRLIQVYLNANQKERLQIDKYIDDTISDAQSRDMKVIIIEDFNINYRKYLMAFINNKWQFSLFRTLEYRRLLDTIPIFNDNDEEMYTYTPADPNRQESRLDYIWTSLPMLEKSVNSTVIENDHFDTDHKTVTLSLNTVQMTGISLNATNQKKKHIKRTVFQYDEMDKDDEYTWKNFSTQLDLEIENTLMKDFSIVKPHHINTL
ncbi:hypothetical protein RclHR1_05830002 [Rhizophagus clarus]|uniref:Endonuclease/exonuclease/phosphatase domain-containing protein n=1 Tax=Rhizophagus clarus TaxID=94130 RepID=A0A2Z6RQ35_9GLOM|nr:hypothetical protein RclHR1_05830002 [Rhizophagus clarus]